MMDVGESIACETAIKLMHKEIGICSRYRVQTRKCVFMDKIRYDTSDSSMWGMALLVRQKQK
jgi:hypothetical protein